MSLWRTYELMRPDRVILNPMPAVAGVFAIYYDGELVYVGSSVDVRNRFCLRAFRHGYAKVIHSPWDDALNPNTLITVKLKRSRRWGDFLMFEARLIRRLKPRFNRQHTGRKLRAMK